MCHSFFPIPSSLVSSPGLQTLRTAITMASAPQLFPPSAPRLQSEQDRSDSPAFSHDTAGSHGGPISPHAKPKRRENAVDEEMLCAMVDAAGILFLILCPSHFSDSYSDPFSGTISQLSQVSAGFIRSNSLSTNFSQVFYGGTAVFVSPLSCPIECTWSRDVLTSLCADAEMRVARTSLCQAEVHCGQEREEQTGRD
jgi:hypothetical protein